MDGYSHLSHEFLPDSALGTAWPAIYTEFNLPISMAGYIAMTTSLVQFCPACSVRG